MPPPEQDWRIPERLRSIQRGLTEDILPRQEAYANENINRIVYPAHINDPPMTIAELNKLVFCLEAQL